MHKGENDKVLFPTAVGGTENKQGIESVAEMVLYFFVYSVDEEKMYGATSYIRDAMKIIVQ